MVALLTVALLLLPAASEAGSGHGGHGGLGHGGGWGHGFHGHGFFFGHGFHGRGFVFVGPGCCWGPWWWGGYPYYYPPSVAYYPPAYYPPSYYGPPPGSGPPANYAPTTATVSVAQAPAPPTVVQYATGRYELRGDGVSTPYRWVWIPNPPTAPPAAASNALPVASSR
ncbi:MAG TPA: hypothetical protein VIF11_06040 [Methylomirabilota bacterium]|jgi:hypothetical protein